MDKLTKRAPTDVFTNVEVKRCTFFEVHTRDRVTDGVDVVKRIGCYLKKEEAEAEARRWDKYFDDLAKRSGLVEFFTVDAVCVFFTDSNGKQWVSRLGAIVAT